MKGAIEQANVLLKELNEQCYSLLHAYEPVLRAIADELLEQETVPGETVYRLIKEHKSTLKIVHEPEAA
jgi:cell division protease FtsH